MDGKNIYEEGLVSKEEEERQDHLAARLLPLSMKAIGDVRGRTVLDIGPGKSTALGRAIRKGGGGYIAFDVQMPFLEKHARAGNNAVRGNTTYLPFKESQIHIAHARLVLMHLALRDRKLAIGQIVGTVKDRALFMEPDWKTFKGNASVKQLCEFAKIILGKRMDLYLGRDLQSQIMTALANLPATYEITEEKLPNAAQDNYGELVAMIAALKSLVAKTPALFSRAGEIAERIDQEANKNSPDPYTLPQFTLVEVKKI